MTSIAEEAPFEVYDEEMLNVKELAMFNSMRNGSNGVSATGAVFAEVLITAMLGITLAEERSITLTLKLLSVLIWNVKPSAMSITCFLPVGLVHKSYMLIITIIYLKLRSYCLLAHLQLLCICRRSKSADCKYLSDAVSKS